MKTLFFVAAALLSCMTKANNVVISNVSIVNNGPGNILVQFDVSWENSWRINVGPANYDGAWVFFRYRSADSVWRPLTLTGNNNVAPAGAAIYQTSEVLKTGTMIYRDGTNMGIGNVSFAGIKLGAISSLPYDIDVKAFALEMVYTPGAPGPAGPRFLFGDGNGASESLNAFHYTDNTATTTAVLPMYADNNFYDDIELISRGINVYGTDTIQKTSPNGSFEPFPTMKPTWCMKYELSQAAYRDFLNTLTVSQQYARTTSSPASAAGTPALPATATLSRNSIEIKIPSNNVYPAVYGCDANNNNVYDEATDGEWVACNFLSWPDLAAYLDWSGLAPMSEIQYEGICRGATSAGPQPAVYGEYAWGNNNIYSQNYLLNNASSASEVITNNTGGAGNAVWIATYPGVPGTGPVRSGEFATPTSNRISSGSSFYGVMEMTGNVNEYCISLGTAAGRSVRFVPNGNGIISPNGNAQLSSGAAGYWPGMEGNISSITINTCNGSCEVTGTAGIMLRGGSWLSLSSNSCAVSYRFSAQPAISPRNDTYGGRGVLNLR